MKYLVGENIFNFNSGTEFSEIQRLKALQKAGVKAQIVTRNYNRLLGQSMEAHGLKQGDVINMYDFFQGTTDFKRKEVSLRLLESTPREDYHIVGIDNNSSDLRYQGKTIAHIHVMPATVGLVGDIEYLDDVGHKAMTEYWDWRGFKSMVETYHPDGTVATQRYLRLDGTTAVEVVHMYINHQVQPSMWRLYNYYGHNYTFDTENQLFTLFLNELNQKEQSTFISDRRSLDQCILSIANPKQTVAALHSLTFNNFKNPKAGILPACQLPLNQGSKKFDKVVFPTEDQVKDVSKVVADHDNFVAAADSAIAEPDEKPRELGKKPKLVYRGMLSTNKNILGLVNAFKDVHKKIPDATLSMQGYFTDPKYQQAVNDQISKLGLKDSVKIVPYSPDDKLYDGATLFINASDNEAFGMNMLESMGHGVPVVTYAVPYVTNNLVRDDVNGCVVKNRSPNNLASQAVSVIANQTKYHDLSAGALKTAKHFSQSHLASEWQVVFGESK